MFSCFVLVHFQLQFLHLCISLSHHSSHSHPPPPSMELRHEEETQVKHARSHFSEMEAPRDSVFFLRTVKSSQTLELKPSNKSTCSLIISPPTPHGKHLISSIWQSCEGTQIYQLSENVKTKFIKILKCYQILSHIQQETTL